MGCEDRSTFVCFQVQLWQEKKSASAQSRVDGCCTEASSCWDIKTFSARLRTRRVVWRKLFWVFSYWTGEWRKQGMSLVEGTFQRKKFWKQVSWVCYSITQELFCTSLTNISHKSLFCYQYSLSRKTLLKSMLSTKHCVAWITFAMHPAHHSRTETFLQSLPRLCCWKMPDWVLELSKWAFLNLHPLQWIQWGSTGVSPECKYVRKRSYSII